MLVDLCLVYENFYKSLPGDCAEDVMCINNVCMNIVCMNKGD